MHDIINLKEMLIDELSEFGRNGKLNQTNLATIDTLAHATKNLCKIIEDAEMMEESSMGGSSYARGRGRTSRRTDRYYNERRGSNYDSYDGGSNYERDGGSYRGNNYRRGGYSRDEARQEFMRNLKEMMATAPDGETRQRLQRMMQNMENE